MMWASAMSQIKGKEEWGSYMKCCICVQCCPVCVVYAAYKELAPHYGIEEPMAMVKPCLPVLSFYQILDTVLVKEGLHITFAGVAPDAGGPPTAHDMER